MNPQPIDSPLANDRQSLSQFPELHIDTAYYMNTADPRASSHRDLSDSLSLPCSGYSGPQSLKLLAQATGEYTRDELNKVAKLAWTDKTAEQIAAAKKAAQDGSSSAGSGGTNSGSGSGNSSGSGGGSGNTGGNTGGGNTGGGGDGGDDLDKN